MWSFLNDVRKAFIRPAMVFLFFNTIAFMFLSSLIFFGLEGDVNPQVPDLFEAFYFTVTTMTGVGFGITRSGKILSMFMMVGGTGIFISFTAVLATLILQTEEHRSRQ